MLVKHSGSCLCGSIKFEVEASDSLCVIQCNCSICRKKQNDFFIVSKDHFVLLSGIDQLVTYTFNTHAAQHLFCRQCGVQSFFIPRDNPDCFGVMPHCIDSSTIKSIEYFDFDGQNWETTVNEFVKNIGENPFNINKRLNSSLDTLD